MFLDIFENYLYITSLASQKKQLRKFYLIVCVYLKFLALELEKVHCEILSIFVELRRNLFTDLLLATY